MRPELSRNPLDLNNFPEDYGSSRDGKQILEESSTTITEASSDTTTTRFRKKRSGGGKDGGGKEECGKVYECRFCSLKFCKSQALGGHMNRHRQERETETLNRARQLVFSNENIAAQGCPHIGLRDPILGGARPMPPGSFHQGGNIGGGDPSSLPFRPVYPSRIFSGTSSTILSNPPPHQPFLYTSSSTSSSPSSRLVSFPSTHYPPPPPPPHPHHNHHLVNDYLINRVGNESTNYTCIGAPVGHNFSHEDITRRGGINAFPVPPMPSSRGGGVDGSNLQNQDHQDGLNWKSHSYPRTQQHLDSSSSSSIHRFQDGLL